MDTITVTDKEVRVVRRVCQVDERGSYHRDANYPKLIFLATVLRWAVIGFVHGEQIGNHRKIVRNNNSSLASVAAFLADHIESGSIPVFSVHTRLPIGSAEKDAVIARLRSMDVVTITHPNGVDDIYKPDESLGEVSELADLDCPDYYLGGEQLYHVVMKSACPIDDDMQKGAVWSHLAWDALPEWRETIRQAIEKVLPWWRQDYNILLQAEIAGDSLRRQNKRTSNRAIGDKIALHIEQEELRGKKRKAPSGGTIKNTVLLGWKYTAD